MKDHPLLHSNGSEQSASSSSCCTVTLGPFPPLLCLWILSALSVAASLIQVVDFAGKIVSKGRQLYRSSDGLLQEQAQTETVAIRLRQLAQNLKDAVGEPNYKPRHSEEFQLKTICEECSGISEKLLSYLGQLKVPKEDDHRKWKSFRQALKNVWSKRELDDLAKRLAELRNELGTQILVSLRSVGGS